MITQLSRSLGQGLGGCGGQGQQVAEGAVRGSGGGSSSAGAVAAGEQEQGSEAAARLT